MVDCSGPDTIARLLKWAESKRPPGVLNLHPAYDSLLIIFDPLRNTHAGLEAELGSAPLETICPNPPRRVQIPVRYGGIDGPDLMDVAELHAITPERVIEIHASVIYSVRFLGFVPGFAYLGGLPCELATSRLAAPRPHVAPGSVGIGGNQTGVYPFRTPGGWRLIGRTDLRMFDPDRSPMALLDIGDEVRFVPS
jgi:KipI family sensor histidine kinase inhibitor